MDLTPTAPEVVDAAKLLAPVLLHEKEGWGAPGYPELAEMIAEETARQCDGELFAEEIGETPGLTLMAYAWRAGEPPRAVLLPESYWRRDVAVAAWGAGLPNIFDQRGPRLVEWEPRHIHFVLDVARHVWPKGSRSTRLAAIALLYRRCYGNRSAREARLDVARKGNVIHIGDMTFAHDLVELLGKKIQGPFGDRELSDLVRQADPSLVDEIMGAAEKGPISRTLSIADKLAEQIYTKGIQREDVQRLVTHVPISIFRDAGELSPMEALAWFLVNDPEGPRLTHRAASDVMGWDHHSQVSTHLSRIGEKGVKPVRAEERAMTLLRSTPSGSMIRAIQIQAPRREKTAE